MKPTQLHDYLLNLKNKNAQDPNIKEYKKEIRKALRSYRWDIPADYNLHTRSSIAKDPLDNTKDVVFYSFMEAPDKPKIGEHEYKRLKLSWSSLRKHNTDIEVRFCYTGDSNWAPAKRIEMEEKWKSLCDDFGVEMYPFHESFTGAEPNAWCIHRWYNLALW